ncbi:hypothetical protein ACFQL4_18305 [Halosimplex aquaticum]
MKENVVDYERLNEAINGVSENLDSYLSGLSTTSVDDLADAYRIGTTRNNSQKRFGKIVEDFSDLRGNWRRWNSKWTSEISRRQPTITGGSTT